MKFGTPPWLKRPKDTSRVKKDTPRALVKYEPPPPADLAAEDEANGWTPASLAAYHAESDARAMAIVAASMEGRLRPRPRWANNSYSPLRWRG